MLDFNHRPSLSEQLTTRIDQALQQQRQAEPLRTYLGASRLGTECERSLQYEYWHIPVDPGRHLSGQLLRIFAAGHVFETLAANWLSEAGFDLHRHTSQGQPYGFSAVDGRLKGHVDGILASGPDDMTASYPALWECKSLKHQTWQQMTRRGVALTQPVYAAQVALYQAYMADQIPGIAAHPALFTAINKNTAELYFEWLPFDASLAQRTSDRAVRILDACEVGELLPRISRDPGHFHCKGCLWQRQCWSGGGV